MSGWLSSRDRSTGERERSALGTVRSSPEHTRGS